MSAGTTPASRQQAQRPRRSIWLLFERKVLLNVATVMFLISTAIMLFEGISRAAFDSSSFWAEESVRYL
ncbi:hypothetical protein IV02_00965, partial [Pseudomonas syringae]